MFNLRVINRSVCAMLLMALLTACSMPAVSIPTATTLPPAATAPVVQPPATGGPAATTTASKNTVKLFFIIGGDKGKHGKEIGCNDSVVAAEVPLPEGRDAIRYAYNELLSHHEQPAGGQLYNALAQSNLKLDDYQVDAGGTATVRLSGELKAGGVCDDPRIQAQLEEIALQSSQVKQVQITINGKPLSELLSGAGQAGPGPGIYSQVKIFMIALEDQGKAGLAVGCGDSAVAVDTPIDPTSKTADALSKALQALLAAGEKYAGGAGLYNALKQSTLVVDAVTVENGKATVKLSGTLLLGGECDNPRVQAQLEQTAKQFPDIQQVEIFVNGKTLAEALSLK